MLLQTIKKTIKDHKHESPIPYGPFVAKGSNCSRFVHSVILAGNPHEALPSPKKPNGFQEKVEARGFILQEGRMVISTLHAIRPKELWSAARYFALLLNLTPHSRMKLFISAIVHR